MGLATALQQFLDRHEVPYEIVGHPHAPSANRIAEAAHISGDSLAKGVVLEDSGRYFLVALPATRHLKLGRLHHALGSHVGLATELEVTALFPDCEPGAVPALGPAYGLETVLDDALAMQEEVFIEGGDHELLVRIGGETFRSLLGEVRRGDFSAHI